MSLSAAFNVLSSSFTANAAQTAIVSRNIANANTSGYARELANVSTTSYGGSEVDSITRQTNSALLEQAVDSTSQAASQQAIADGLSTLAQTVNDSATASSTSGSTQNGNSPSAMLANLQNALATYASAPSNAAVGQGALIAAKQLAGSLNSASTTVQAVRSQADSNMASSVSSINSLLSQFSQANTNVVAGLQAGIDVSSAQDNRDNILSALSQQIGISTATSPNGSISIYTDSGATLFQESPRILSFASSAPLTDRTRGNAVTVGGIAITGPSAPMAIHSGALAGFAALRDIIAPQYQSQLDQIAGGLISAFSESDQSATPTLPTLPGLFTVPGATAMPTAGDATGLAASIGVNPNVDPSQGGDITLLQNGGIGDPANAAYTYNSTGAAGYTSRIQQLTSQISTTQTFDPAAGLGASSSLADYATASVSWLQGQNQQATDQATYQNAVATQASSALSNATGVNLDTEMTNMLNLENSYTTTAKLLTTISSMFSSLISAV